jgi:hypothetical protein
MLKTVSAALIAVSVLASPAFAGGLGHASRGQHSHPLDAKAQMHRGHIKHHHGVRSHFNLHKKFGHHKTFRHSGITAKTVHKHG